MKNYKKYLYLIFFVFSFNVAGQAIDPSILSQLSPEQIEMVKDAYAGKNSTDKSIDELPVIEESLVTKKSSKDANKMSGQKYGYDFFSSTPSSLTAVGDLPLPNDYKISLRDQFTVILSGSKDAIFNLNVKLDGTILFPELGAISVVGLSLQEVKDKLARLIEQSYIGVNIDISMQNLSAKKITIVGAVKTPGTYLINPFSTITGALAYSGGISEIGSLRDIKLIRNNKEIFSFDLYDLLINGDRSKDLTLEAGDTLLIKAASQFVEINGAVKRPAIYEILENETLENIVDFALGFNHIADKSNISVSFFDSKLSAIINKNISSLDQSLDSAFSVNVFRYMNPIEVTISGEVVLPGKYTLNDDSSVEDLYQLVGGFKDQAFLEGIILTRELIRERQIQSIQKVKEGLNRSLLTMAEKGEDFDINTLQALSASIEPKNLGRLSGDFSPKSRSAINTILSDGDTLIVPKIPNSINVFGEVLNPIAFKHTENLTVKSAINYAGGYQQYADKRRVYVIRANGIIEKAHRNIFTKNANTKLKPGDTVVIPRKIPRNNSAIQAVSSLTQILFDLSFSAAALDNLNSN